MTECPKCKGYGIVGSAVPDILRGRGAIFSSNECDMCHGSGEVQMTNEEYLKSLDTEQLAKRLHDKDVYAFFVCKHGGKVPSVEHYVEWLKEKHE